MPAIALDLVMTDVFANVGKIAYFSPYHQRPPELNLFLKRTTRFNTNNLGINAQNQNNSSMESVSVSLGINDAFDEIQKNQLIEIQNLKEKILKYVFDAKSDSDVDAISETIDYTYELISKFGPAVFDLSQIASADDLNGEHLAAILRITHSQRNQIPGWDHALTLAIKALETAKLEPHDALAGII